MTGSLRTSAVLAAGMLANLLMAGGVAAQAPDPLAAAALEPVANWYLTAPIVGMTIAVARPGEPPLIAAWGHLDEARSVPAAPGTVYEIGSITKTFTAALVLRRVDQGRISLEDPASRWLPELRQAGPHVTIRHLLAHTSGLASDPVFEDLSRPVPANHLLRALRERPVEFEPGARFRYNNNGYALLGLILEREAGLPYRAQLQQELLGPLGLENTEPCEFEDPDRPTGFDHAYRTAPRPVPHPRHHPDASGPAGLLCSTAGDLLRWQAALMGGAVLAPATLARMIEAQTLADGSATPYGLGIYVDADGERLHHGGAVSGFITQMAWRPRDRMGVVVLTNGVYSGALVERLEQNLARVASGGSWAAPLDLPVAADDLEGFTGVYRIGAVGLEVFVVDDHLRARPAGQVATRLLHLGDGRFQAEHDPATTLTFLPDGSLLLERAGRALPPGRKAP